METLAQLLEETARVHGGRPAVALRGPAGVGESWTYLELYRYARAVERYLRRQGLRKGDRVILWAASGPRWPGVFYGAMFAGLVVVPLDVKSTVEFVGKIEARSAARLLVGGREQLRGISGEHVPSVALEDLDALLPPDDSLPGESPLQDQPAPDDPAELVFTSGTTGAPKGVVLTHRNILSDAAAAARLLSPRQGFSFLSLLPLSHMLEQMAEIYAMLGGSRVVYMDTLQPAAIFGTIEQEKISVIPCVPQVLALFMSGIEREVRKQGKMRQWEMLHAVAWRLPFSLRRHLFPTVHRKLGGQFEFFVCGGAYLDPFLGRKWEAMGVRVIIGYGLTEAAPVVTLNSYTERDLHSVGRPIACNEVKIASDGEVLVRGTNVFPGYWQDDAASAEAFEEGWYRTGDLGELTSQGRLRLRGRKKNVIVLSNGFNVYPEDVEQALMSAGGALLDAVVFGLQNEGEVDVHAVLLTREPTEADALVRLANRRLAPHQHIRHYTVWPDEDFPRTATLKARRLDMLPRVLELRRASRGKARSA